MKPKYILLLSAVLFCMACTTPTGAQQSQANPLQTDNTKMFQKILFVALLKDDYTRRLTEDKLVEAVAPRGVASYSYLPNYDSNADTGLISGRLRQDGFDGIVIMRLITPNNNNNNASGTPGNYPNYYNSWYGYYNNTYPIFNMPGTFPTTEMYNIETNVYSLNSDKLLWSDVTPVVNNPDKSLMIDKLIATIQQKMMSQGFLQ